MINNPKAERKKNPEAKLKVEVVKAVLLAAVEVVSHQPA